MQTYTHFLMTAVTDRRIKNQGIPVPTKAFLLGSVMPDVPLYVLSLWFIVYYQFINPLQGDGQVFADQYDTLYFNNPLWMIGHNLFHAPLMILLLAGIGYQANKRGKNWGRPLLWFAMACGLHSFIDILTHYDDGPLLFFPFNWQIRFPAPISYWDPAHGGLPFTIFEHCLNLLFLGFLFLNWRRRRKALNTVLLTDPH